MNKLSQQAKRVSPDAEETGADYRAALGGGVSEVSRVTRRDFVECLFSILLFGGALLLVNCQPAKTVADIIQGAACGLAYAETGQMPPGCDIPVPMMRQQADVLEKKLKDQQSAQDAGTTDAKKE
jgi:hypothetical protein